MLASMLLVSLLRLVARPRLSIPMMLSRQPTKVSNEWELDFYSRPVQGPDGKKLWELLVTDAQGTFQHVEAVPSNCVNSRELRARVQRLIDDTPLKPKKIRFFRTQMKNMISIALNELPDVLALPSRATYQLYDWIDERQREVPLTCPRRPPRHRPRAAARPPHDASPAPPARPAAASPGSFSDALRTAGLPCHGGLPSTAAGGAHDQAARQAAGAAARREIRICDAAVRRVRSRRQVPQRPRLRATAPAPARTGASARPRDRATARPRDRATARAA